MSEATPDRAVLVTGAAAGIGRAISEALIGAGRRVLLADRSPSVVDVAATLGPGAEAYQVDLEQEPQVVALAEYARDNFGCDILINNAGIHPKTDGRPFRMEEVDTPQWQRVLNLNLTVPFILCRELIPAMRARGWGRVVNMGSRVARTYVPFAGVHYSASKAGLIGMTRQLAGENAPFGVTVNCVVPGRIDTPTSEQFAPDVAARLKASIPANRWGRPEEVAAAVAFLTSDSAAYVTGICFDINGGAFIG